MKNKYPHHGDVSVRIEPVATGTDYFGFKCVNCPLLMSVTKLRQCIGGGNTGRLIINLKCTECGFNDARKLHFGLTDYVLLETCKHPGNIRQSERTIKE